MRRGGQGGEWGDGAGDGGAEWRRGGGTLRFGFLERRGERERERSLLTISEGWI